MASAPSAAAASMSRSRDATPAITAEYLPPLRYAEYLLRAGVDQARADPSTWTTTEHFRFALPNIDRTAIEDAALPDIDHVARLAVVYHAAALAGSPVAVGGLSPDTVAREDQVVINNLRRACTQQHMPEHALLHADGGRPTMDAHLFAVGQAHPDGTCFYVSWVPMFVKPNAWYLERRVFRPMIHVEAVAAAATGWLQILPARIIGPSMTWARLNDALLVSIPELMARMGASADSSGPFVSEIQMCATAVRGILNSAPLNSTLQHAAHVVAHLLVCLAYGYKMRIYNPADGSTTNVGELLFYLRDGLTFRERVASLVSGGIEEDAITRLAKCPIDIVTRDRVYNPISTTIEVDRAAYESHALCASVASFAPPAVTDGDVMSLRMGLVQDIPLVTALLEQRRMDGKLIAHLASFVNTFFGILSNCMFGGECVHSEIDEGSLPLAVVYTNVRRDSPSVFPYASVLVNVDAFVRAQAACRSLCNAAARMSAPPSAQTSLYMPADVESEFLDVGAALNPPGCTDDERMAYAMMVIENRRFVRAHASVRAPNIDTIGVLSRMAASAKCIEHNALLQRHANEENAMVNMYAARFAEVFRDASGGSSGGASTAQVSRTAITAPLDELARAASDVLASADRLAGVLAECASTLAETRFEARRGRIAGQFEEELLPRNNLPHRYVIDVVIETEIGLRERAAVVKNAQYEPLENKEDESKRPSESTELDRAEVAFDTARRSFAGVAVRVNSIATSVPPGINVADYQRLALPPVAVNGVERDPVLPLNQRTVVPAATPDVLVRMRAQMRVIQDIMHALASSELFPSPPVHPSLLSMLHLGAIGGSRESRKSIATIQLNARDVGWEAVRRASTRLMSTDAGVVAQSSHLARVAARAANVIAVSVKMQRSHRTMLVDRVQQDLERAPGSYAIGSLWLEPDASVKNLELVNAEQAIECLALLLDACCDPLSLSRQPRLVHPELTRDMSTMHYAHVAVVHDGYRQAYAHLRQEQKADGVDAVVAEMQNTRARDNARVMLESTARVITRIKDAKARGTFVDLPTGDSQVREVAGNPGQYEDSDDEFDEDNKVDDHVKTAGELLIRWRHATYVKALFEDAQAAAAVDAAQFKATRDNWWSQEQTRENDFRRQRDAENVTQGMPIDRASRRRARVQGLTPDVRRDIAYYVAKITRVRKDEIARLKNHDEQGKVDLLVAELARIDALRDERLAMKKLVVTKGTSARAVDEARDAAERAHTEAMQNARLDHDRYKTMFLDRSKATRERIEEARRLSQEAAKHVADTYSNIATAVLRDAMSDISQRNLAVARDNASLMRLGYQLRARAWVQTSVNSVQIARANAEIGARLYDSWRRLKQVYALEGTKAAIQTSRILADLATKRESLQVDRTKAINDATFRVLKLRLEAGMAEARDAEAERKLLETLGQAANTEIRDLEQRYNFAAKRVSDMEKSERQEAERARDEARRQAEAERLLAEAREQAIAQRTAELARLTDQHNALLARLREDDRRERALEASIGAKNEELKTKRAELVNVASQRAAQVAAQQAAGRMQLEVNADRAMLQTIEAARGQESRGTTAPGGAGGATSDTFGLRNNAAVDTVLGIVKLVAGLTQRKLWSLFDPTHINATDGLSRIRRALEAVDVASSNGVVARAALLRREQARREMELERREAEAYEAIQQLSRRDDLKLSPQSDAVRNAITEAVNNVGRLVNESARRVTASGNASAQIEERRLRAIQLAERTYNEAMLRIEDDAATDEQLIAAREELLRAINERHGAVSDNRAQVGRLIERIRARREEGGAAPTWLRALTTAIETSVTNMDAQRGSNNPLPIEADLKTSLTEIRDELRNYANSTAPGVPNAATAAVQRSVEFADPRPDMRGEVGVATSEVVNRVEAVAGPLASRAASAAADAARQTTRAVGAERAAAAAAAAAQGAPRVPGGASGAAPLPTRARRGVPLPLQTYHREAARVRPVENIVRVQLHDASAFELAFGVLMGFVHGHADLVSALALVLGVSATRHTGMPRSIEAPGASDDEEDDGDLRRNALVPANAAAAAAAAAVAPVPEPFAGVSASVLGSLEGRAAAQNPAPPPLAPAPAPAPAPAAAAAAAPAQVEPVAHNPLMRGLLQGVGGIEVNGVAQPHNDEDLATWVRELGTYAGFERHISKLLHLDMYAPLIATVSFMRKSTGHELANVGNAPLYELLRSPTVNILIAQRIAVMMTEASSVAFNIGVPMSMQASNARRIAANSQALANIRVRHVRWGRGRNNIPDERTYTDPFYSL